MNLNRLALIPQQCMAPPVRRTLPSANVSLGTQARVFGHTTIAARFSEIVFPRTHRPLGSAIHGYH